MWGVYSLLWYTVYKQDLALNNLQELICHEKEPKNFINHIYLIYIYVCKQFHIEDTTCRTFIPLLRSVEVFYGLSGITC